ncbi:hypothetical protein WAI453_004543 [Rhynchosporium graminicola]
MYLLLVTCCLLNVITSFPDFHNLLLNLGVALILEAGSCSINQYRLKMRIYRLIGDLFLKFIPQQRDPYVILSVFVFCGMRLRMASIYVLPLFIAYLMTISRNQSLDHA